MEFDTSKMEVLATRPNKVIYRCGDYTIKVFAEDFSKADILNEALNTARVEETGLNIAKVQQVTMIDGKWAIVFDYIEGTTLAELMEQNPDKLDEYLDLFVNLQLEIQSKRARLLNKLKDKMERKISETGLDATTRYELDTRLAGMSKKELAEKYMKLYCKKSDTARQYVQQWLPIVAASQSVKGKPEEREFLLSWVNVVEYQ